MRDGGYTRPVSDEELALLEKFKDKLIPLCSVPRCEKVAGHDGDHGAIQLNLTNLQP